MSQELYYEDFYVGQKFGVSVGQAKVTAEEIKELARSTTRSRFIWTGLGENWFFEAGGVGLVDGGDCDAATTCSRLRWRAGSFAVRTGVEMRSTLPVQPAFGPDGS